MISFIFEIVLVLTISICLALLLAYGYSRIQNDTRLNDGEKIVIVTPAGKQIIQIRKNGIWQFYSKYPNTKGDCEDYWM